MSVLQCVAIWCRVVQYGVAVLQCCSVAVVQCCSVAQCLAMRLSVAQCVAVCNNVLQWLHCVAAQFSSPA